MPRYQLILCVPHSVFDRIYPTRESLPQSVLDLDLVTWDKCAAPTLNQLVNPAALRLFPRDMMEDDLTYRQPVGYALVRVGGKYAHYRRAGGDDRLFGRRTLGFGGHIEVPDLVLSSGLVDLELTVEKSVTRELQEELGITASPTVVRQLGVLALRNNPVSLVHLGIVIEHTYDTQDVVKLFNGDGEVDKVEWSTPDEMRAIHREFEGWSEAILPHL